MQFILQAYFPEIDKALGIFIPLIVVNCIILARAEAFAGKNRVFPSMVDGLSMGLGFTLALLIMGSIRELLGNGTLFDFEITANLFPPASIMVLAPGVFNFWNNYWDYK